MSVIVKKDHHPTYWFCLPDNCFVFCSFDALVLRFEAPDSRNRWDSPLFTILKDDTLPFEDISDALFKRKAPPPNQSTQSVRDMQTYTFLLFFYTQYLVHIDVDVCSATLSFNGICSHVSLQQPLSSANFLYELDKITQEVLMVCLYLFFWIIICHLFFFLLVYCFFCGAISIILLF